MENTRNIVSNQDQGPWGQAPQNNNVSPLDQLIKKRSNGGGGGQSPAPVEINPKKAIMFVLVLALIAWIASGFRVIEANERGVVRQFGKYHETLEPGLKWHIPYPIQTLETVNVSKIRCWESGRKRQTLSSGNKSLFGGISSEECKFLQERDFTLMGDRTLTDVYWNLNWSVSNAQYFLFNVQNPEEVIKNAAKSSLREQLSRVDLKDGIEKKMQISIDVEKSIQDKLDDYKSGIRIEKVNIPLVEVPGKVRPTYDEKQDAENKRDSIVSQAKAYAEARIIKAQELEQKAIIDANAYKAQVELQAEGEAKSFSKIFKQYITNKELYKNRLYVETMESVLSNSQTMIIDPSVGTQTLLPLKPLIQK